MSEEPKPNEVKKLKKSLIPLKNTSVKTDGIQDVQIVYDGDRDEFFVAITYLD